VAKVTVISIGVIGIVALLMLIAIFQPYSQKLTVYQPVVQIAPQVSGRVVEVPVEALAPVKKGDVLFRIDPQPFQYQVDELTAAIEEARSELNLATTELERAGEILEQGAGSPRDVDSWKLKVTAARGTLGTLEAELDNAQYNLRQTEIVAPADGFVADLQLFVGSMAQAQVPVLAFVDSGSSYAIALMSQNSVRYIRAGDSAEVALKLEPGRIFNAQVQEVVRVSAQKTATGLISAEPESSLPAGTIAVRLDFLPDVDADAMPSGAIGAAAVYTSRGAALRIIRRVVIRLYTWMNFLP
jgi:RND family efflux transporter MFP subunit